MGQYTSHEVLVGGSASLDHNAIQQKGAVGLKRKFVVN